MELITTTLWVVFTLYCLVMYVIGLVIFNNIMHANGGFEAEDLRSLDFWALVGILVVAPISIPFYTFRDTS